MKIFIQEIKEKLPSILDSERSEHKRYKFWLSISSQVICRILCETYLSHFDCMLKLSLAWFRLSYHNQAENFIALLYPRHSGGKKMPIKVLIGMYNEQMPTHFEKKDLKAIC